jgi:hypothetical protein
MSYQFKKLNKSFNEIKQLIDTTFKINSKYNKHKSYLDISNEDIFNLNNKILNNFIDNNLTNNKRIILIVMECILCFMNVRNIKELPDIFNKFDYIIRFAIDIKPKYTKYQICKSIELWINERNINYNNLDDISTSYMFLIKNNYIDIPSIKKWLYKDNITKYISNSQNIITLTNYVLLRTQFIKILDYAKEIYKNYNSNDYYSNADYSNADYKLFLELKNNSAEENIPKLDYLDRDFSSYTSSNTYTNEFSNLSLTTDTSSSSIVFE